MDARIEAARTFPDDRGKLSVVECGKGLDFEVKRIYYIYGVPSPEIRRGFHSHKKLRQHMICMSGSCSVLLDDGKERKVFELSSPDEVLYVGPGIWREMFNFTDDAVLMVAASENYDGDDYIRDYSEFLRTVRC